MKIPDERAVRARVVPARAAETGIGTGMKRTRRKDPEQISRRQISRKLAHVAHVFAVVRLTTYYLTVPTRLQDLGNNGTDQTSTEISTHYRLETTTTISLMKVDLCYKLDLILLKILQVMDATMSNGALYKQDGSYLQVTMRVYHFNTG